MLMTTGIEYHVKRERERRGDRGRHASKGVVGPLNAPVLGLLTTTKVLYGSEFTSVTGEPAWNRARTPPCPASLLWEIRCVCQMVHGQPKRL